jgi:hypothetical protein
LITFPFPDTYIGLFSAHHIGSEVPLLFVAPIACRQAAHSDEGFIIRRKGRQRNNAAANLPFGRPAGHIGAADNGMPDMFQKA